MLVVAPKTAEYADIDGPLNQNGGDGAFKCYAVNMSGCCDMLWPCFHSAFRLQYSTDGILRHISSLSFCLRLSSCIAQWLHVSIHVSLEALVFQNALGFVSSLQTSEEIWRDVERCGEIWRTNTSKTKHTMNSRNARQTPVSHSAEMKTRQHLLAFFGCPSCGTWWSWKIKWYKMFASYRILECNNLMEIVIVFLVLDAHRLLLQFLAAACGSLDSR